MSAWPVAILFGIVIACGWILSRCIGAPSALGRFTTIDGLRGYLAFGVFIHHGALWYNFLHTGTWDAPPSYLYQNLGQATVLLFFMITGFLFWTKLLRAGNESFDWMTLYFSRLLRLVPLYLLAVALMTLTVGIITGFQLREPITALSKNVLEWSAFSVTGIPDINRLHSTAIIIGKVTWTLPYEWLFYCALPLLAVSIRVASPRRLVIGSVALVAWLTYEIRPEFIFLIAFCGGIAAACLVHLNLIQTVSRKMSGSIVATVALCLAFAAFPTAKALLPVALLSIAFAIVAGGNSLFGMLTWPVSRFLGELTYSLYLLHSIVLFWMFRFVIGSHNAIGYSLAQHWVAIACCIPAVLILCSITFRFVELPAMKSIGSVTKFFQTSPKRQLAGRITPSLSGIPLETPQRAASNPAQLGI